MPNQIKNQLHWDRFVFAAQMEWNSTLTTRITLVYTDLILHCMQYFFDTDVTDGTEKNLFFYLIN